MQIQGHTLEEQDELSADFQDMIVRSLHHVVDEIALKVARESMGRTGLIAAGPADDVIALWEDEVPELIAYLDGVYDAGALEAAAEMAAGLPVPNGQGIPGVPDAFVLEYLQQASNRLKGVGDELWENIRDEIIIGLENGETTDQIAGRIRAAAGFTEARAKTVARTELVGASNAGTHAQVLMIVPDAKKEWVATTDGRTRFTHRHADGQKVPVDQAFIVGGSTLRWPGDPGGAAGEVVNCRCTLIFDVDDDTEPALTCDPNAVTALMSALVNMPGSSCTCAVTIGGGPTGLPTNLTQAQHDEIYSAFMNPDPISPAYGGAKIYKKLVAAKAKLAADAPELAGLSEHQILAVVDEIYKGKKFTFTEKFDEWLPTAAGKKAAPHVNIPSPGTHATPPPISHTIPTPATVAPKLPPIKKLPKPSELTYTGKTLGSHGAQVWTDADGGKWLFKPQKDFMTDLDTAVAKIQSKAKHTRTGTYEITLNGKKGSIQYMYDGSSDAFPGGSFDPTKLSPADLHAMQQEQIFDWMVSNFDTHSGQWIRLPDGQLVSVDKGQAFKFFGNDKLDWNYVPVTPLGNDKLTYSQLWKAFIDGKVDLKDPTVGDLGQFIDDLMSIPDAEYRALLKPYVDNLGLLPPKFHNADELLDAMVARKNNLKKDFSAYWAKAQKEKAKHSLPSGPTTPSTPTPTPPITSVIPPPPGPVVSPTGSPMTVHDIFQTLIKDGTKQEGDVIAYGTHSITGVKFRLVKKKSVSGIPYMDMEQWGDSTHKWHDMGYPVKNSDALDSFGSTINWESAPHPSPLSVPTPSSPPVVTITPPATPSTLTTAQKNVLLQLMKDPQPITPGWGGAKVYKQLATIKAKAAGNPAFTGMSDKDILKAIDEVAPHATAKTYESVVTDWLNTPAGKKYAGGGPEVLDNPGPGAVVTPPSTPSVVPTPATSTLGSPDLLNTSSYSDLQIFANVGDPVSASDIWKAKSLAKDGDILAVAKDSSDVHVIRVVGDKLYFSTKNPDGSYYYDVEIKTLAELENVKKNYGFPDWKTPKGTSLPDGSAGTYVPIKKVPGKKATPSATPTLDAADTILTADNDITKYSLTQQMDVLASFKTHVTGSYLTDTPEQIFEHLQQTLLQLKTNPSYQNMTMMQLVKMIDEAGAKKMGVANKHLFETKMRDYLKTPSGKAHAAKPVKKAAKKAAKKVAKKATPSYSTTPTPVTPGTKPPTPSLSPNVQAASPTSTRSFDSIYHAEVLQMRDEMMAQQGDWSAAQKSSLRYYTSNAGYDAMNKCLRGLGPCSPTTLKHIREAQAGMRRTTRNAIFRRGTYGDEFPGFSKFATFADLKTLQGRRLKADSFLSSSYGDRPGFDKPVWIEFEAPAGTPVGYLRDISHYPGENEMLLGAGLEYEVLSVTQSGHKTIVRVRIIVP